MNAIIVRLIFLLVFGLFSFVVFRSEVVAFPVQQTFDNLQISESVICNQVHAYYDILIKDEESDIVHFIVTCNPEYLMYGDMFVAIIQIQRASDGEWTSLTVTFSPSFTFASEYLESRKTLKLIVGEQALTSLELNSILNLFNEGI